jgi:hypothetical protein
MQRVTILICFLVLYCLIAESNFAFNIPDSELKSSKIVTIDLLDTVVFDISKSDTLPGGIVSFPVSIASDDTVNALDFSFKYNEDDFEYDSIVQIANYLQTFSFYNPFDSTLRFTSNSFQRYSNDTALLKIYFTKLNGEFCKDDLKAVKVYLNGNTCSSKIVECIHTGIGMSDPELEAFKIAPVPADNFFVIEGKQDATIELIGIDGRRAINTQKVGNTLNIETQKMKSGIYCLHIYSTNFSFTKNIVIQH